VPGAKDAEVAKLAAALADQQFRDAFMSDYSKALTDRNIDPGPIRELIDTLRDTSKNQLDYLASVRDVLTKHGHSDRVKAEMV